MVDLSSINVHLCYDPHQHRRHHHLHSLNPDYIRLSLNSNLSLSAPTQCYHGNPSPDSWMGQQMVTAGLGDDII